MTVLDSRRLVSRNAVYSRAMVVEGAKRPTQRTVYLALENIPADFVDAANRPYYFEHRLPEIDAAIQRRMQNQFLIATATTKPRNN